MTEEEKKWFDELSKRRTQQVDLVFNDSDFSGIKNDVVEKYPDTAHFIYELIQNADDTGATNVEFILEKDRLLFKHNGHPFSMSDVKSIVSIGNSTKQEDQNTIGKFGVGFKSVFQYTSTPKIYDRDFCFGIKELVIPFLIDEDHTLARKKDETLFVFQFNVKKKLKDGSYKDTFEESYQDISNKLQSLSYPSMFLNNIQNIKYTIENDRVKYEGEYKKEIIKSQNFDENTTAEFVEYVQTVKQDILTERFWKFNRKIDESSDLICSIAFLVDEKNNQLKPIKKTAFCFFPTREDTKLNFLINAPFLLTANRESILANKKENKKMIEILSQLAGDSLVYLRDIVEEKGIRYIDDNILDIVPLSESAFYCNENEQISFLPFYTQMKNKFKTEKLLPTKNGYVTKENAYWSDSKKIKELFSNEQIGTIFGNSAEWVFFDRNDNYNYIKEIAEYIADYNILNNITTDFIEKQSISVMELFST